MNFPKNRKLNEYQIESAKEFLEIESKDFPDIVQKYQVAIDEWLKARSEI